MAAAELEKTLTPKHLLKLLKAEKNPTKALSLFDSATTSSYPNYTHTSSIYHHILRCLSQSLGLIRTHLSHIISLLQSQKCPCHEDIPLTVIKLHTQTSMPDQALEIFEKMIEIFGCQPGVRSYNSVLNALVESNQWRRAELFFGHFRKMGVEPNLESFNVLIKISCARSDFYTAKDILERIYVGKGLDSRYCKWVYLAFDFVNGFILQNCLMYMYIWGGGMKKRDGELLRREMNGKSEEGFRRRREMVCARVSDLTVKGHG